MTWGMECTHALDQANFSGYERVWRRLGHSSVGVETIGSAARRCASIVILSDVWLDDKQVGGRVHPFTRDLSTLC